MKGRLDSMARNRTLMNFTRPLNESAVAILLISGNARSHPLHHVAYQSTMNSLMKGYNVGLHSCYNSVWDRAACAHRPVLHRNRNHLSPLRIVHEMISLPIDLDMPSTRLLRPPLRWILLELLCSSGAVWHWSLHHQPAEPRAHLADRCYL